MHFNEYSASFIWIWRTILSIFFIFSLFFPDSPFAKKLWKVVWLWAWAQFAVFPHQGKKLQCYLSVTGKKKRCQVVARQKSTTDALVKFEDCYIFRFSVVSDIWNKSDLNINYLYTNEAPIINWQNTMSHERFVYR